MIICPGSCSDNLECELLFPTHDDNAHKCLHLLLTRFVLRDVSPRKRRRNFLGGVSSHFHLRSSFSPPQATHSTMSTSTDLSIKGWTALVTGASSGTNWTVSNALSLICGSSGIGKAV